jgi:hypothetical protein
MEQMHMLKFAGGSQLVYSVSLMAGAEVVDMNILERQIRAICTINDEIIERIVLKIDSGEEIMEHDYLILTELDRESTHHPYRFKVEEIQTIRTFKHIVDCWEVPSNAELPESPDPEKIFTDSNKILMDMTCTQFSDLVRINAQVVVFLKYTSMLRESISFQFGLKFLRNFELVQVLLGTLENAMLTMFLQATVSRLEEKQDEVNRLNEQMAIIFRCDAVRSGRPNQLDVSSGRPYRYESGLSTATISTAYQLNKGTILSSGIHRWHCKCINVVEGYNLGVVSLNKSSNFGSDRNQPQSWGLRNNGEIQPGSVSSKNNFSTGDILTFVLNCSSRTLAISINGAAVITIANVILPVQIAFSGEANAQVEICKDRWSCTISQGE